MSRQKTMTAVLVCSVLICVCSSHAQQTESLFSENTASLLMQQARRTHQSDPLDPMRTEQAMTLLTASASLDVTPGEVPESVLRIGGQGAWGDKDYSQGLMWALDKYLDKGADLEVASGALRGVLDRMNSRVDREVFLEKLFRKYSSVNSFFASEVATQIALLAIEKADMQTAQIYLNYALGLNPYNQLASSQVDALLAGQEESQIALNRIMQSRLALEMNPYDLKAAMDYADLLREEQVYDSATKAYAYMQQLHEFLHPDQLLPEGIIQNWLLSCYHTKRGQSQCLGLTETYRRRGRLNLVIEAVAGKTLINLGRREEGRQLLESAAQKAEGVITAGSQIETVQPEYLSWFYSFALEQPEKALAWSNQAFVADPNRHGVAAMFSYALVQSGQNELAKQYAEPLKEKDQIASLTWAMVLLREDQKQQALDALRKTVNLGPETFVAEKAKAVLDEQDSDYILPDSLGQIQTDLQSRFGSQMVPTFVPASERCSVKLLFNGSDFLYGADFPAKFVIKNTSDEPLVISDDGFLTGRLRIDAQITGHLNVTIPELVSMHFRPSAVIRPGTHLTLPMVLNTGRLSRILMTYPQADVEVSFTAYLDPILSESGQPQCRMKSLKPVHGKIHRQGIAMNRDFLLQRLDVLTKGQRGQKYRASSLFTGLLAEQVAVDLSGSDYKFIRVERELLIDSVRKLLVDKDWKIRAHTLSCLSSLSIPVEGMIGEISGNLNHDTWPVRMMAMILLNRTQPKTFQKVLDWSVEHDSYVLNRQMAEALGGQATLPESDTTTPEIPE